jgi:hypothetical protein
VRLGARWSRSFGPAGRAFVHGAVMADAGSLSLVPTTGGTTMSQWTFGGGLEATAGWELGADHGWVLSLEAGGAWRPLALHFSSLAPAGPGDDTPAAISSKGADAGSLGLGGVVWRLSGGYRF